MATRKRIYKTCIAIPKGTDAEYFVPSGMTTWKGMNGRDMVIYHMLCSFDGIATAKQISSVLTNSSVRTILRSLKKMTELGYVKYEEVTCPSKAHNVISLAEIKNQKTLNQNVRSVKDDAL